MKKFIHIIFIIFLSCKADPLIITNEDFILSENIDIIFCENKLNNQGEFLGCYIDDCIAINNNCYYENDYNFLSNIIIQNNLQHLDAIQLGLQQWSYGRLISLKINNLQLMTVPENIGDLITHKELYLTSNNIISIPESIGDLYMLTDLNLENNQLTSLPETICNIQCDCNINLDNNNLCDEFDFECLIDTSNQDCFK